METHDTELMLRPEYTLVILDRLVNRGDSINLVGEKGTGKSRLIDDLRRCSPGHVKILFADIKAYKRAFNKLLEDFAGQLGLAGSPAGSLGTIFAGIENRPGRFLVLLDNYDALLGNPDLDPGYTETFFTDLNALKNKDNVSLLCTSCIVHHSRPVYIAGNTLTSPLSLDIDTLPPLTFNEIDNEILRRLDEYHRLDLQTHPGDREMITKAIHGQEFPYPALKWYCAKLNGQNEEERALPFKKKFQRWKKAFKKNARTGMEKGLYKMSSKVEGLAIAAKANKIKIPILSDLRKLIDKWTGKLAS